MKGRASDPAKHKPHRSQHPYPLRGCVRCGLCGRRMQGHRVNHAPYYRCRFPAEYALPDRVEHPLSVNLREDAIVGHVDQWLAREFVPQRLTRTIRGLVDAQAATSTATPGFEDAKHEIAECDRKLAQYRAALDSGASPATVAGWICETEAERAKERPRRSPSLRR